MPVNYVNCVNGYSLCEVLYGILVSKDDSGVVSVYFVWVSNDESCMLSLCRKKLSPPLVGCECSVQNVLLYWILFC